MKRKDNARGFIRLFSLECLVIALIIFPLLHTHAAPHQANEREEAVQEIVESRDSAVILFGRAQNMFALLFDDFDITLRNNDNKTIIASGRAKIGDYIGSVNRTVSRLCFLFFASYLCADFISAYK